MTREKRPTVRIVSGFQESRPFKRAFK